MNFRNSLFACLLFVFFLQACCMGIKCNCLPEGLYLTYRNTDGIFLGRENSDLRIKTMITGGQTEVSETAWGNIGNAEEFLYFTDTKNYWIIFSDSMAIRDTLVIMVVKMGEGEGCCACPKFDRLMYRLGADVLTDPIFTRLVP